MSNRQSSGLCTKLAVSGLLALSLGLAGCKSATKAVQGHVGDNVLTGAIPHLASGCETEHKIIYSRDRADMTLVQYSY